jgi:hypothetical protein
MGARKQKARLVLFKNDFKDEELWASVLRRLGYPNVTTAIECDHVVLQVSDSSPRLAGNDIGEET